ncbi:hypothetical protein BH20VER3_BH20VER3_00410 [soil metagenome]
MNLPFLRYFKKEKTEEGNVAVAPRPATPIDKPASQRFGKTVMPNTARVVGVDPAARTAPAPSSLPDLVPPPVPSATVPAAPGPARKISLGKGGSVSVAPSNAGERIVALSLADLGPHLPPGLLQTTPIDPEQRVLFKASELERGMASGRPAVLLRSIYQQAPDYFMGTVAETDEREVLLPFGKVLEQFTAFQVRPDQVSEKPVPQLDTPFLKMTIEDGKRHGTAVPASPAPAAAEEKPAPTAAPPPEAASKLPRPIRLPLPDEVRKSASDASAPGSSGSQGDPVPVAPRKISPNGMGAPATEKVPASSGPPVPTPLPAPFAPAPTPPARVPFKISPPSNDLRESFRPGTTASSSPAPVIEFSREGPRVSLPLRNLLRGISPFQLSGPIEEVPESVTIEIPFSIIEPQLSLGRVALSPAQFQAAMPAEFRTLLKIEDAQTPIALPLQEVLQNLPNESLQLRGDQEEVVLSETFETPFSRKAAEDATRMNVAAGPISKADAAAPVAPTPPRELTPTPPGSATPATGEPAGRSALQAAFDTDEALDAKAVVAHASRLPGVSACAIVFSDGLSLAGNIPAEYQAEGLCALAPALVKRIDDQMMSANLGHLDGVTLFCARAPVSFFAHGNICLAALHSAGEIASEIRARLDCAARELARMYAQPA